MARSHLNEQDGSEAAPLMSHAVPDPDISNATRRIHLSSEDSRRICRKTDRRILAILVWVYFLQILDKTVLGFGATYGLREDTHLSPGQFSLLGSVGPLAQLISQPLSSLLIIKVPHRILMPALCLGWGLAQTSMAACHTFHSLMLARFLLGVFEAGCLPLFSVITSQWYRRAEQPIRVAAWYSTNGAATVVAAASSYALGHLSLASLRPWQLIFLAVGLLTVASAPVVYRYLDNDIATARFLTEEEREQAVERLRANQTSTAAVRKFQWRHVAEAALETKTYLWIAMTMLLNIGASVTNVFGPLIISGLGFDKHTASLLNMPFGALQLVLILAASLVAQRARLKGAVLAAFMLPVVAGLLILSSARGGSGQTQAPEQTQTHRLLGFYLLSFLFGGNPLIVSWIVGNTAGTTKKAAVMSMYNAASSIGNIIGPLLFDDRDAPSYTPGLRACLGIFVALVGVVLMQWVNLAVLNRLQEVKRMRNGKTAKIVDRSMLDEYQGSQGSEGEEAGDVTDGLNDEFIYIY